MLYRFFSAVVVIHSVSCCEITGRVEGAFISLSNCYICFNSSIACLLNSKCMTMRTERERERAYLMLAIILGFTLCALIVYQCFAFTGS